MSIKTQFPKHDRGPERGSYIDPKGHLEGDFNQLMEAGCIQAPVPETEPLFHLLMRATACNPCAGCPLWASRGPLCEAFVKYHSAYTPTTAFAVVVKKGNVPVGHPLEGLSVKQIAAQLGVSISEVRRRKASGTL